MRSSVAIGALVGALVVALGGVAHAQEVGPTAAYFSELEKLGLVDASTGSQETLKRELDAAEQLLREGDATDAAVALYTIVESPRYADFSDFVEYQNAEYYLGVALQEAGATGGALEAFERVLHRGPEAAYWGPAHRHAVDLAIETRDFAGVLARIEATDVKRSSSLPTVSTRKARTWRPGAIQPSKRTASSLAILPPASSYTLAPSRRTTARVTP